MSKEINVLNHITGVLQQELPIKEIQTSLIDDEYLLEIHSNDGNFIIHTISKYDLEYLEQDTEIYYYTKVVIHTVSRLLQNLQN